MPSDSTNQLVTDEGRRGRLRSIDVFTFIMLGSVGWAPPSSPPVATISPSSRSQAVWLSIPSHLDRRPYAAEAERSPCNISKCYRRFRSLAPNLCPTRAQVHTFRPTANCVNTSFRKNLLKNKRVRNPRPTRDRAAFGWAQRLKRVFGIDGAAFG